MSKPDDITQEVWDEAIRLYDETYLPNCPEDFAVPVARAIMAAIAQEREECAKVAERTDRYWDASPAIADAIRSRP
jgi:hypothetical protein